MDKLLKIFKYSNFKIIKGSGVFLFDDGRKKYLDFSAGIAVNALGYNHPLINKTLKNQLRTGVLHLAGSHLHKYKILLSSVLSKSTNKGRVFFSNSGAESVEAALKFAKMYGSQDNKNKNEIIAMQRGFHGRTLAALSVGSNKNYKSGIGEVPKKVKFCKFNDSAHLHNLVNAKKTLAIIMECVQGEGGIYLCSKEFAKTIKELCKKHKILLIIDEIQAGMGRTGKIFSYKHYGFKPDIITIAKALGSGYPVAATVVSEKISKNIKMGMHGSTFGGGMMQTRLASEVIKFINRKSFLNSITNKGKHLSKELNSLKKRFPKIIKEVRGMGLMAALEINSNYDIKKIVRIALKKGLILTIVNGSSIRITPPLIISKKEIDLGISKLQNSINSL